MEEARKCVALHPSFLPLEVLVSDGGFEEVDSEEFHEGGDATEGREDATDTEES